jgi:large subunit ribosomal protein L18
MSSLTKKQMRVRRHLRVRNKVRGSSERPRMSIFKSNSKIEVQFVDDDKNITLLGISSSAKNLEAARNIGAKAAELALSKGINEVIFDRGGFSFGQNLKALADSAREAGLKF